MIELNSLEIFGSLDPRINKRYIYYTKIAVTIIFLFCEVTYDMYIYTNDEFTGNVIFF